MHSDSELPSDAADPVVVQLAVEVFAMLADATRIQIVLALRQGELPVGRLADIVQKSPTSVSQHLAKLRLSRMVSARQEGNRVFYRLTDEHALALVRDAILQAEHGAEGVPQHHGGSD